ncbi:cupin domain-containing protein [Roseomonas marmotae]|uniref:Cupin domain-containing protein n=1 Tax=Roseomonas marmotae TaxID=2768161 RepID=A0ABS3KHG7_9PROT|nr:cupin domain-containing protein [Roseomonas marmotae]MBO1075771.1 cupin domain-containing protein [Roseomonas marmotae]QTI80497.1 cupin domain-containing protein [Roseomonas marmotae]
MKEPLRCRPPATGTVQIDSEDVRVMRWDFPPGAETGWHRHGFAYVVVPLHPGRMLIELPDGGTMDVTLTPGQSYERVAGTEHNVVNAGTEAFSFVEIEMKSRPG